jgi:hypothetical protein
VKTSAHPHSAPRLIPRACSRRLFIALVALGYATTLQADDLIDPTLTIGGSGLVRAVIGSSPLVDFSLTNGETAPSTFGLAASTYAEPAPSPLPDPAPAPVFTPSATFISLSSAGITAVAPSAPATPGLWSAATLAASATGTLQTQANLSGLAAGESRNLTITANRADWNAPTSATTTVQAVANRLLTGSVTIDAGRHMLGQSIGTLTLSGGAQNDSQATRIDINANSFAQYQNGLRLTNTSAFTFNGANQTHDVSVGYNGNAGSYTITQTLPAGAVSSYTDASGQARADFGGQWKVVANYGNIYGQKTDISLNDDGRSKGGVGPFRYPWESNVSVSPTVGGNYAGDPYGYSARSLVTTAQPAPASTVYAGSNPAWELSRGSGVTVSEREHALLSGERITGSALDLTGVSVNITGTALNNRVIYGGVVDLGRVMLGSASTSVNRTDNLTLSTYGSDDVATRLTLAAINTSANGLTASTAGGAFNSANSTASLVLSGNFTRSTASVGYGQSVLANTQQYVTGEGLAGESVQAPAIGYNWTVVQNQEIGSTNSIFVVKAGSGTQTGYGNVYNTKNYGTYIGVDSSVTFTASSTGGIVNNGVTTLNAANGRVTGEGLAGETVIANTSFNTYVASITDASFELTTSASNNAPLKANDTVTLKDNGSGPFVAKTTVQKVDISGNESGAFEVTPSSSTTELAHGSSLAYTIKHIGATTLAAGSLGRVDRASLDLTISGVADISGIYSTYANTNTVVENYSYGFNSQVSKFALENRVEVPAAATGSTTVASGTDFSKQGLLLTNTTANTSSKFSTATEFQVRGGVVSAATPVTVTFKSIDNPALAAQVAAAQTTFTQAGIGASGVALSSDIVELSGLNGMKQVLEISFNAEAGPRTQQVIWQTNYDGQIVWVNAVLGNSNISLLNLTDGTLQVGTGTEAKTISISAYLAEMNYAGSYDDYVKQLAAGTDSELGKYGYDSATKKAWAVIDHNSQFAVASSAIPEPSTYAAIFGGLALGAAVYRRRRSV